jgi:hypothetical protein
LTLGDGGKIQLDTDPLPVGMVELMDKKVLARTDQAETTKGKKVSDELHNRMIKPHNPEIGMWKENVLRKLEKGRRYRVTQGIKWDRFFEAQNLPD